MLWHLFEVGENANIKWEIKSEGSFRGGGKRGVGDVVAGWWAGFNFSREGNSLAWAARLMRKRALPNCSRDGAIFRYLQLIKHIQLERFNCPIIYTDHPCYMPSMVGKLYNNIHVTCLYVNALLLLYSEIFKSRVCFM